MYAFTYERPKSVEEAVNLLKNPTKQNCLQAGRRYCPR